MKKQFDVVIGNPPYSKDGKTKYRKKDLGGTKGAILWHKFARISVGHMKENGYLCLVHPGGWRKPKHKLLQEFKKRNLLYLEMHERSDGNSTFGSNTAYDWYVVKNEKYGGKTIIKDSSGMSFTIDLSKYDFIPNCEFELINSLIAKGDEETCPVIHNSKYSTNKQ